MEFTFTTIDPYNCSIEELENEIKNIKDIKSQYHDLEQSIKLFLNSTYGACASQFFVGYNVDVAEAVTLQGQDLIRYANKVLNDYFQKEWHKDKELHEKLGITYANAINSDIVIYNDTDSVISSASIICENSTKSIETLYNDCIINGNAGETLIGHESVKCYDKILNFSPNKGLYYANIKRIIRHKVNKPKWEIKTKTGKSIIITNDHSIIVYRNNKQIVIKASECTTKDKIICIK